jgi:lysophospholipase L1-like esterase
MTKLRTHVTRVAACLLLLAAASAQDTTGSLPAREAFQLYRQIGDHMEATSIAVPELARAGAPLIQNVRQTAQVLQIGTTREHVGVLYKLLLNAKIYLDIADAVPKANPFSDEVDRQLAELRRTVSRVETHFRGLLDLREQQRRNADRDNLKRYAEENSRLRPPKPDEKRVVFLGDSITDGWPLNQYFPGKLYINRGIGGQITSQMLGRMQADVLRLKPSALVVLAGTNDIARGVSNEAIQYNLSMIADLAVAHDIQPIFASILPVSDHHKDSDPNYERTLARPPSTILALNGWIQEMCRKRGFIYLDYFSATVDSAGQLQADLAEDGLHPNAKGYQVMGPLAQKAINEALKPKQVTKKKRLGIF